MKTITDQKDFYWRLSFVINKLWPFLANRWTLNKFSSKDWISVRDLQIIMMMVMMNAQSWDVLRLSEIDSILSILYWTVVHLNDKRSDHAQYK